MELRKRAARTGGYCILLAGATFVLLPFVWMLLTSLKPSREVLMIPPKCFPSVIMWESYMDVYHATPFTVYFFNSAVVLLIITAEELVTTVLAAYAFSQVGFKGRDAPFILLAATMMVPGEILIIPDYVTLVGLGWINTYKVPILPWYTGVFSIFLLKQQFSSIPTAHYKVARIDGCRGFQYLITIMVPMSRSAIVATALLKLINSWNSYTWPLIMTNTNEMRILPVALAASSTEAGVWYNTLMAFSLMIISPILLVYFFTRKYIIRGVNSANLGGW